VSYPRLSALTEFLPLSLVSQPVAKIYSIVSGLAANSIQSPIGRPGTGHAVEPGIRVIGARNAM
jgi:hypothetical protein